MNGEQIWLVMAAGSAVALVLLVALALLWRSTRRLTARIEELEAGRRTPHASAAPVVAEPAAYAITTLSEPEETAVIPARIDGALFADIVARESVIRAAGLVHGLRRALSPENRNRIRFEMRRQVKRSRRQRRADLKSALRDVQTRTRAEGDAA